MFIVSKVAFGSSVKREKFMFDLSTSKVLEFAGSLQFIPINPSDQSILKIEYGSVKRAIEVFDEIVQAIEDGKLVYHLPEE